MLSKEILDSLLAIKYFFVTTLKFSFSEKATKFAQSSSWFWRLLSKCQNHEDDCANSCGLLRKVELYIEKIMGKVWSKLTQNGRKWVTGYMSRLGLSWNRRQNMLNLCRTFMSTLNGAKISQVYIDPFVLGCLILRYKHHVFVYSRATDTFVKLNWR